MMGQPLTAILADYLTGRISTDEALRRSKMQAVDDLVRAVRSEGDAAAQRAPRRKQVAGSAGR